MTSEGFYLISEDKTNLFVNSWLPVSGTKIKGVVQIAHGMAEHSERYADFAKYLTSNGYAVYANDHRGHGKTAENLSETGYIPNDNSWKAILRDMFLLNNHIHDKYPDTKIILIGHSMGSFYVRAYMDLYPETINCAILIGTAWHSLFVLNLALFIAKFQCLVRGSKNRSNLLNSLSFGSFGKKFKPNKTPFDWLSRDNYVCTNYTNDPFCGFVCTSSFFRELFRLIKFVQSPKIYTKIDKKLPVLIISGSMDPVGNFSKGAKRMYAFLKSKGFTDITLNIYTEGRHEMLNEINKKEVYKDILNWLSQ